MKKRPVTYQDLKESLIYIAWLQVHPDDIMLEIDRACARLSVAKETFTIKTLTPIYPLNRERLIDRNYYQKNELDLEDIRK